MSSIDERIVSMKFDNADFEKGVSQTLSSLDKLNQSIEENTKSNKAFSGLQDALDGLNFDKIGNSIESISDKFSVWGVVGAKVISDLTGKVEQLASKMMNAVTGADYAKAGWTKYGEKTANVATLVSQGYDLSTVENQLSKLMWYTDETSYDFSSMVSNIAKFTAAGQKLDSSVTAMEGIANWAATAGQNASTCTRAMYQLSQAMGKGALKYDDFKSVQNFSMDTQEFRKKSLEAAEALGTLKKVGTDSYTTLEGHLVTLQDFTSYMSSDKWYTSDVMMKVFSEYAEGTEEVYDYIQAVKEETGETITASEAMSQLGYSLSDFKAKAFMSAQECKTFQDALDALADAAGTSWMSLFETIFGNYYEAKALWTGMANDFWSYVTAVPNALGDIFSVWKDLGGRTDLLQSILNLLDAFDRLIAPLKQAFADVFGGAQDWGSLFAKITAKIKDFTAALKINNTVMAYMYGIFTVLFRVVKAVFQVLTPKRILAIGAALVVVKTALSILSPTQTVLGRIVSIFKVLMGLGIFKWLTQGKVSLTSICNLINKVAKSLFGVEKALDTTAIKNFAGSMWRNAKTGIKTVIGVLGLLVKYIVLAVDGIKNFVKNIKLVDNAKSVFETVKKAVLAVYDAIVSGAKSSTSWVEKLSNIFKNLGKVISSAVSNIDVLGSVSKIFTKVGSAANLFFKQVLDKMFALTHNFEFLPDFSKYENSFAQFVDVLKNNLSSIPIAIESVIRTVIDRITSLFKSNDETVSVDADGYETISESIDNASYAAEGLAVEIKEVNQHAEEAAESIGVFGSIVSGITGAASNVANKIGNMANSLSEAASSSGTSVLGYLADKLEQISGLNINWGKILGIAVVIAYFAIMNQVATMISTLAGSINKFVTSCTPLTKVVKDLLSNAGTAVKNIGNFFGALSKQTFAKTFRSIAISLTMLAGAMALLTLVDQGKLWNAVLVFYALAAGVSILSGVITFLSTKFKDAKFGNLAGALLTTAAAVLIFSAAMATLAKTLSTFKLDGGGYDWAGLAVLFGGIASEILIFVGVMALVAKFSDTFKGAGLNLFKFAGSLISLAIAILAVRVALEAFSGMIDRTLSAVQGFISALMSGEIVVTKDGLINGILTFGVIFEAVILILSVGCATIKKFVGALSKVTMELAKSMVLMAGSILIIAYAMKMLSEKATWSGVAQLGVAVIALGALLVALKKFNITSSAKSFSNLGKTMIEFSASLLVLALALKAISSINSQGLENATVGMGLILSFMLGFVYEVKMLNGVNIGEVAAGMLSLVVSMYLLLPLFILFGALDFDMMIHGIGLVAMGLFALSLSVAAMKDAVSKTMVGTIISMSAALAVMAVAIIALSQLNIIQLAKGIGSLVVALAAFTASVFILCKSLEKLGSSGTILQGAAMIGAMAASVFVLATMIRLLSECDLVGVAVATGALSVAMIAFGFALSLTANSFTTKDADALRQMVITLGTFAGVVIALSAAIALVATQDIGSIITGTIALGAALFWMCKVALEMQNAFKSMNTLAFTQFIVTLAASAGSMLIIAGAIRILGNLPWTGVIAGAVGLGVAFFAMSTGIAIMAKQMQNLSISQMIGLTAAIIAGAAAIYIITKAVNALVGVPWQAIGSAVVIIVAMTAALSVLALMCDTFSDGAMLASVALLAIAAAFTVMVDAVNKLVGVPWQVIGSAVVIIVAFTAALTVLAIVFQNFAIGAGLVIVTLVALCAVLISFGVAAVMFGVGATLVGVGATLMATAFTMMTNALILLLPYIMMFINYIIMAAPYTEAIMGMATALTNIGIALGVIGAGAIVAGVALGVISIALAAFNIVVGLFAVALGAVTIVFALFVNQLQQFLTFIVTISTYQETLNTMSTMFSTIGKSLIVLGAGAVVAAAGGALLAIALNALSKAMTASGKGFTIAGAGFTMFCTSISTGVNKVSTAFGKIVSSVQKGINNIKIKIGQLPQLGLQTIAGFVTGIGKGLSYLVQAASNIGSVVIKAVCSVLGIHSPAKEFISIAWNCLLGFVKGSSDSNMETSGVAGIGSRIWNGVKDGLSSVIENFGLAGGAAGDSFLGSMWEKLKGLGGDILNKVTEITGIDFSDIGETMTNIQENGWGSVFGLEDRDINDYLADMTDGMGGLDEVTEELTGDLGDYTDAADDASGSTSSASESAEDLAEKQKTLAKYTKYSTAVMNTFAASYGGAAKLLGNTSSTEAATAAFNTLFEKIFENSDSASETFETAADKAQAMQEAFNEAFESIASDVEGSIDLFSKFDKSLDSVVKPSEMIKNAKSQVEGITDFYEQLNTLALKGFSDDIISDLIDEGTSAYPKMISMLKATADEVEQLNQVWESKEAIGYQSAITAMTARMTALQVSSLKETIAAHKAEKTVVSDANDAYKEYVQTANKALEDGKDLAEELKDENTDLSKSYKTLSEAMDKAGLTSEDLQKVMEDGKDGFEESADTIEVVNTALDEYRDLAKKAAEEGKDISEESIDENTELGKSYKKLLEAVDAAGFSVEDLYNVMANDASFVDQYDYVEGLINVYTNCQQIIEEFKTVGDGIFDNVQSNMEGMITYFSECDTEFEMTAADIRKNLQDQLKLMTDYNANINKIIQMGGGKLVAEYGDKITAEIAAALVEGGSSLVTETYNTFKTLEAMPYQMATGAQNAWEQYGKVSGLSYNDAITQAANAAQILQDMYGIGTNVSQGLANGMSETSYLVSNTAASMAQQLMQTIHDETGCQSPSTITTTIGNNIDQGLINGMRAYSGQTYTMSKTLSNGVISQFKNTLTAATFESIGNNISIGLVRGISAGQSNAINAAASVAKSMLEKAKAVLDINSPSREFAWIGKMSDAGMAEGLSDNAGMVEDSITTAMRSALQSAYDLMNSDVDMNPTITPVIDLSDAQNGAMLLSSMFNGQQFGFTTNTDIGRVTTNAERMNNMLGNLNAGNNVTNGDTVLNIYGAQGQNVNQLADIVINRLNNEYARRKAAWS